MQIISETLLVSWDQKRKGTVEDEDVPLPSKEPKRLESLLFSRYKLRFSADEDAREAVVSCLKRQLSKHCIRFESILETKTTKEETAGPRVKRTKPGDENELVEREEPERKQPKTITAEAYPDALWTYILGLARAGVEELQDKPSAAETDGSQTYDYMQIPLDVTANHPARAKLFTVSLPRALLPLQCEVLIRRAQPLQKHMEVRAVLHPHYLGYISVALVSAAMYVTKWQDHILPTRLAGSQRGEHHFPSASSRRQQLWRTDDAEKRMSIRSADMEEGAVAHCTPACSVLQAKTRGGRRYRPPRDRRRSVDNASNIEATTCSTYRGLVVAERQLL